MKYIATDKMSIIHSITLGRRNSSSGRQKMMFQLKPLSTFKAVPGASLQGFDNSLGSRISKAGYTSNIVFLVVVIVGEVNNFDAYIKKTWVKISRKFCSMQS